MWVEFTSWFCSLSYLLQHQQLNFQTTDYKGRIKNEQCRGALLIRIEICGEKVSIMGAPKGPCFGNETLSSRGLKIRVFTFKIFYIIKSDVAVQRRKQSGKAASGRQFGGRSDAIYAPWHVRDVSDDARSVSRNQHLNGYTRWSDNWKVPLRIFIFLLSYLDVSISRPVLFMRFGACTLGSPTFPEIFTTRRSVDC